MRAILDVGNSYDFKDGNGLVAAHLHRNGGGWVADSAHVADSARVDKNAGVFGYARICDYSVISGNAEVSGFATVKDYACVKGRAVVRGSAIIMDNAEILDDVVVVGHFKIGGDTILDKKQQFFSARDCLNCPAMLGDNYTSSGFNPCLYCIKKLNSFENVAHDSRRRNVLSWLKLGEEVNQNSGEDSNIDQTTSC